MPMSQRLFLIATSVLILLLIAISLSTVIEARTPPPKMMQVSLAQAAKYGDQGPGEKDLVNGGASDHSGILQIEVPVAESTSKPSFTQTPAHLTAVSGSTYTQIPTPRPSPNSGASFDPQGTALPAKGSTSSSPQNPQIPVIALSYSGASGPKHCRGTLLLQSTFPPPLSAWKNGTCITLPSPARCGMFYASKNDNCETQLFNKADCENTKQSYVNTVVFMPEERAVGALWRSMYVRCGVEVEEVKPLDPAILGGMLKSPGGG